MKENLKIDFDVSSHPIFKRVKNSLLCLVVILSVGCSLEPEDLSYKQHKFYPEFEKYCGICHNLATPLSRRYDYEGWKKNIARMRSKDKELIQEEDAEKILVFLSEVRPPK